MADSNIYEKLRKVQLELKVPKSQRNNFGNYNYRNAEDILEAVKPVLDKYELTLLIADQMVNLGDRYYVRAKATITDGTTDCSVTAYAREEETKKGMDGSQITGAASSYARKYALSGLFAIDDTADADSHDNTAQPAAAPKPAVGTPATEALATGVQRAQIKAFMTSLGVAEDDIPGVLASDYGVEGKLTKAEAVRVLKELQ